MKKLIIIFFIAFIGTNFLISQTVNGDTLTYDGKKILKVWGTHSERGYAYGYLMGNEIKDVAENYVLASVFANSAYVYSFARTYFSDHFSVEENYQEEVQGMIAGMQDAGVDLYSSVLGRDLDETDILVANSIVDLSSMNLTAGEVRFGCSSLSDWGTSTQADPELNGNLVICRHMDWTANQTLLENHLLLVNIPSEENEIAWISFTFPGMIGALSGISQNGIAAFMDVGNYNSVTDENDLHPIFLSIRNGLEQQDYNSDGEINPTDVYRAISDKTHLSPSIVHAVNYQSGIVIETNNALGSVVREDTDNTQIPENNLAATNHFRELYSPVYCYRYEAIIDSLNADANVSVARNWNILCGAAGNVSTLHTIQYVPTLNFVKWSTAKAGMPAYLEEPTEFDINELFSVSSYENEELTDKMNVKIFPNPFSDYLNINFDLANLGDGFKFEIYNLKGEKIGCYEKNDLHSSNLKLSRNIFFPDEKISTGIFFYKLKVSNYFKTGKILFIK